MRPALESFTRLFGCDLRSLAALRMALALLLLAGLALRLPEFHAHYTDDGAWPLAAARAEPTAHWPLALQNGSSAFAMALFGTSALAALALLLGWWTRMATVLSWFLLVLLQSRNHLVLNGGDAWLRLLLFWGMFLPLGACWSLDARGRPPRRGWLVSWATAALLLQVVVVYLFNALYKTGTSWHAAGTAIEDSLRLETYATGLVGWLLGEPELLQAGTRTVWRLEMFGPLLVFIPWRNGAFRLLASVLFMGFHLALFCTLRIGLFPLIGVAAWLAFWPSGVWDVRNRSPERPPRVRQPWILQGTAIAALALMLAGNLAEWLLTGFSKDKKKAELPGWLNVTVRAPWTALRLTQKWQLFAPRPATSEGWHVAVLECADGREYDALTGKEVDWSRPTWLGGSFPTVNWRKFLASLREGDGRRAQWYCAWLVREWERTHPGAKVQRVRLHYLWEWTAKRQSPPTNRLVYENPPGPLTEQSKALPQSPAEPAERSDN